MRQGGDNKGGGGAIYIGSSSHVALFINLLLFLKKKFIADMANVIHFGPSLEELVLETKERDSGFSRNAKSGLGS